MPTEQQAPAQFWRVQLIASVMARLIDLIPADASLASRRARFAGVHRRARRFALGIADEGLRRAWLDAYSEAWRTMRHYVDDPRRRVSMAALFPLPH